MRDFFKGWRRKIGVVTLGLALTLVECWIFSQFVHDWLACANPTSMTEQLVTGGSLLEEQWFAAAFRVSAEKYLANAKAKLDQYRSDREEIQRRRKLQKFSDDSTRYCKELKDQMDKAFSTLPDGRDNKKFATINDFM